MEAANKEKDVGNDKGSVCAVLLIGGAEDGELTGDGESGKAREVGDGRGTDDEMEDDEGNRQRPDEVNDGTSDGNWTETDDDADGAVTGCNEMNGDDNTVDVDNGGPNDKADDEERDDNGTADDKESDKADPRSRFCKSDPDCGDSFMLACVSFLLGLALKCCVSSFPCHPDI